MKQNELWEKASAFHGHECGGLAIGFKASLLAIELLGLDAPAKDEEIVCVSENDACGVDAIQAILGCTAGKGNLLFWQRGKQAFSFFNRKKGCGLRLVLKEMPPLTRGKKLEYIMQSSQKELFVVKKPKFKLPERARIFSSLQCSACGETTAEQWLRLQEGKPLCLDCFDMYEEHVC